MRGHDAWRRGGVRIANIKGKSKEILAAIVLVGMAFFVVNIVAVEVFNVTGSTLIILNLAPTFLGLGLLLKYLDVF